MDIAVVKESRASQVTVATTQRSYELVVISAAGESAPTFTDASTYSLCASADSSGGDSPVKGDY